MSTKRIVLAMFLLLELGIIWYAATSFTGFVRIASIASSLIFVAFLVVFTLKP